MSEITKEEYQRYWEAIEEVYAPRKLQSLEATIDPDDPNIVELHWKFVPVKFERIRRITGYLTGNTTTWNSAKQAELDDRKKHDASQDLHTL